MFIIKKINQNFLNSYPLSYFDNAIFEANYS